MELIWTREDIAKAKSKQPVINFKSPFKKRRVKKVKKTPDTYRGQNGYRLYLKTKWWIKRRARYWRTHKRICYCCGQYATELHHNNYSRLFREQDKDFVPLCHDCHTKTHNLVKSKVRLKVAHKKVKEMIKYFG